jgi:hypothetical protein
LVQSTSILRVKNQQKLSQTISDLTQPTCIVCGLKTKTDGK